MQHPGETGRKDILMGIVEMMGNVGVKMGHKLADAVAPGTPVNAAFNKAWDVKEEAKKASREAWDDYKEGMRESALRFVGQGVLDLGGPLNPNDGDHGRIVAMKLGELFLALNDKMDAMFPFVNEWDRRVVGEKLWKSCDYRLRRECEVMRDRGEVRLKYWDLALASAMVCQTSRIKRLARLVKEAEVIMGMNAMCGPFSGPLFKIVDRRTSVRYVDARVDLSVSMTFFCRLHAWTERPSGREEFVANVMRSVRINPLGMEE